MRPPLLLSVILVVSSLLLWSCASRRDEAAGLNADVHWLADDRIESTLKKQNEAFVRSLRPGETVNDRLETLRQLSDIQLELCNQESMQLTKPKSLAGFPAGTFRVSELNKFLPLRSNRQSIGLVLVAIPPMFPADQHKPSLSNLLRTIDGMLREHGVQRRVFQFCGGMYYYVLDSDMEPKHE
jgi:hypothetical protein